MSTTDNTATSKADVYQKVTDAIVNAIESGIGQYRMPWTDKRDIFTAASTAQQGADFLASLSEHSVEFAV